MKGIRFLLPAALALASTWWACDSRTVTNGGNNGDPTGREVASVEVSVQQTDLYYSQSTRTALRDTVTVLVLDAERSAIAGVSVSCEVQSSFGGALIPLTNHETNDNGEAMYAFRVLASDQPFEGEQTVTFVAAAGNRSGTVTLTLHEQSDIQLAFLNPADGTTINRMEDPAETLPVQVYAYRDVTVGDQTQRVGVQGVLVNFAVSTVGVGIPGVISAQGTTGSDGVTGNVYYANSSNQPADTVLVRFSAAISGSPDLHVESTVNLLNDYGYRLERILPQNPQLHGDQLCQDSTRFVYQYRDRTGNPVTSARFNIQPGFGEMTDPAMYSLVSDDAGILQFTWRSCALEGGDLVMSLVHTSGRAYNYIFAVADARPIDLAIINPIPGGELEIDSECLPENVTNVRALLKYADNNNPIVGRNILFSATHGQVGSTIATDANGVASVTWQDCDENDAGETLTLSAAFLGNSPSPLLMSVEDYLMQLPLATPHHITLAVSNPVLPDPDTGALQSSVTATVYNSQNQRLGAGMALNFETNGVGQITTSAFTNDQGQAVATFSMNNQTGISQILARYFSPGGDSLDSTPAVITVQSGLPSNVTLATGTPRIQILGFGAASVALVTARVVDASGATVTMDVPVRFTVQAAPEEVFISMPGSEQQYFIGDTLDVTTQNGMSQMTINAGTRPGTVQILAIVELEGNAAIYSTSALVTIVAGPPAYGSLDYDPTGIQIGASYWRVRWAAHFWDRYSNEVEDSTAVYFYLDPPDVAAFDGFGLTGFDADDGVGHRGIAEDWMQYHCNAIGDTIDVAWACSAGEVPEYDNPFDPEEITGWHPGDVCVMRNPGNPLFQLPFQAGDRDDNLTVTAQQTQCVFTMTPCNPPTPIPYPPDCCFLIQSTLIDGYGCPVKNQLIQFWSDTGGTIEVLPDWLPPPEWGITDPAIGLSDMNGVVRAQICNDPRVLQNLGAPCATNENCWNFGTYTLNYGAYRLPDGNPASNDISVTLSRPCQ